MSKLWSDDKSMFATFGKSKDGTYTATIHMAAYTSPEDGAFYPAFGTEKAEGFATRNEASMWADLRMNASQDDEAAA